MPSRKLFVNIVVSDLPRSMAFFRALGLTFNPQFTNEAGACMVVSDEAFFMLHTPTSMARFTAKPACDLATHTGGIYALAVGSRAEVDQVAGAAEAVGAGVFNPPTDLGFMYLRSFLDPDGHPWEVFWMDPAHAG